MADAVAARWDQLYQQANARRHWPNEELVRFAARHENKLGDVLEVGCGDGANLWFLSECATTLYGLDASAEALALATDTLEWRTRWSVRRAKSHLQRHALPAPMPFIDGRFTTVVDCMVSQHLPWAEHEAAYREYRRVLRAGGRLFLCHLDTGTSTGGDSELGRPGDYPDGVPAFPAVGLTCIAHATDLRETLGACGFSVARTGYRRIRQSWARADGPVQFVGYSVFDGEAV